jgi:hypothetical protein
MTSARRPPAVEYKAALDKANLSPARRREAEAWLADRAAFGQADIVRRRKYQVARLQGACATAVNTAALARAIAARVRTGAMSIADAAQQLRDLEAIRADAAQVLPEAQENIAALAGLDPLVEADAFVARFPPIAERIPPPPQLT